MSGPSRARSKSKCPRWRRAHAERWRVFEEAKLGLTEGERALKKKIEELMRVREHLQDPSLGEGMARELRKHVAILEAEIAELQRLS